MLSDKDIKILLDKKRLISHQIEILDRKCSMNHPDFGVCYFAEETPDKLVLDFINELGSHFSDKPEFEFESLVENLVSISLPSNDSRLNVLVKLFDSEVTELKSRLEDWEFTYLTAKNMFENLTYMYSQNLEHLLNYDEKTDSLTIVDHLPLTLEIEDDTKWIRDHWFKFKKLQNIEWLRNQIELEKIHTYPVLDQIPEAEYKTQAQKLAWLYKLGVLQTILNQCKEGETYNYTRAANIIHSFTEINIDTIRQGMRAIYQPNENNNKNNPLNNPDNKLFVANMTEKFKLNKEK